MFKNEFKVTQSYIVSKKEKKDIAKKLTLFYSKNVMDYIVANFDEITLHKTTLNKKRILTYQNNPIFFEYDNDTYYPTVYLLNMFPDMLVKKAIIYEETDTYLDNGADLMLKGVLNRAELKKEVSFRLNDLFSVQTVSG